MAKCSTVGIDGFITDLYLLAQVKPGPALYDGGKIIADELKARLKALPIRDERKRGAKTGVSEEEKEALIEGMGIARAKTDYSTGAVYLRIGFDGYDDHITPHYPKGHPLSMIVRALEAGASSKNGEWLKPTPVIKPTLKEAGPKAEKAMSDAIEKQIISITKRKKSPDIDK